MIPDNYVPGVRHSVPRNKKNKKLCCAKINAVYCDSSSVDPTRAVSNGSRLVLKGRIVRSFSSIEGIPMCTYPDFLWSQATTPFPDAIIVASGLGLSTMEATRLITS